MVTADYYGKIQMLSLEIEGYVLSDGTACLSELGAAKLLGFGTRSVLDRIASNLWPKELGPCIGNGFELPQTMVKIIAPCPHNGLEIKIYTAQTINTIARAYATAYLQGSLRKNQLHIGLQCATLRNALADAALEQVIYDACQYKGQETLPQKIERYWKDHLFQELQAVLWQSIQNLYPDREDGKYRWIMANTYRWLYRLILGEEEYKAVNDAYQKAKKQKGGSGVCFHQFIEDAQKREDCKKLLKVFVAVIEKHANGKLPEEVRQMVEQFYELYQVA
jgi:hypothetical protein